MSEQEKESLEEVVRELRMHLSSIDLHLRQIRNLFAFWGFVCGIVPAFIITVISALRLLSVR